MLLQLTPKVKSPLPASGRMTSVCEPLRSMVLYQGVTVGAPPVPLHKPVLVADHVIVN